MAETGNMTTNTKHRQSSPQKKSDNSDGILPTTYVILK